MSFPNNRVHSLAEDLTVVAKLSKTIRNVPEDNKVSLEADVKSEFPLHHRYLKLILPFL